MATYHATAATFLTTPATPPTLPTSLPPSHPPSHPSQVDTQFFYSGVPWEVTSRDYASLALNLAYNVTTYTAANVVYANAMEGIGFLQALEAYNKFASKKVPYSIMRGNSDYTHQPIMQVTPGNWTYVPPGLPGGE